MDFYNTMFYVIWVASGLAIAHLSDPKHEYPGSLAVGAMVGFLIAFGAMLASDSIFGQPDNAAKKPSRPIKQPLMIGAIGLAMTVMIYQFAYYFSLERGTGFTTLGVLGGIGLGIIVGAIAGGVAFAMMRDG